MRHAPIALVALAFLVSTGPLRAADDPCAKTDFTPAPHKSGCASLSFSPKLVRPGGKITVSCDVGCGGGDVFCSAATNKVLVGDAEVIAVDQTSPMYHGTSISPHGGYAVHVPQGHTDLVFTIDPKAGDACVTGYGSYTGPFVVVGSGTSWSTPDSFEIADSRRPVLRVRVNAQTPTAGHVRGEETIVYALTASCTDDAEPLTIAASLPAGADYVPQSADQNATVGTEEIKWSFVKSRGETVHFSVKTKPYEALKQLRAVTTTVTAKADVGAKTFKTVVVNDVASEKLELTFDPSRKDSFGFTRYSVKADGFSVAKGQIECKDSLGAPIGGADVRVVPNMEVDPLQTGNPRMLVTDQAGFRIFPKGSGASLDFITKPKLRTDSEGKATFRVLAGTHGTELVFAVEDDADHDVSDGKTQTFATDPAVLRDSARVLERLDFQLQYQGARFAPSGKGSAAEKQNTLLEWLGQLRWTAIAEPAFEPFLKEYEFAPVHSSNGRAAVLFYARGTNPNSILESMAGPGPSADVGYVLDVQSFNGAGNIIDIEGNNGLPKSLAGWEAEIGARAEPGRLAPWPDEKLVYWGWPYPPPNGVASAGQAAAFYRRTISGAGASVQQHSPVNLLFTDPQNRKIGVDADGKLVLDAPGVVVRERGRRNPSGYALPSGAFDVGLTGTGSGPATISFDTAGADPKSSVFTVKSKKGATGAIDFDGASGATDSSVIFGGKRYDASEGLALTVLGSPKSLKHGKTKRLTITVRDPFRKPVVGAVVSFGVNGYGVLAGGVTDAKGRARFSAAPPGGLDGFLTVTAPGFATAEKYVLVK